VRRTSLTLTALAAAACLALAGCSGSSKNASATSSAQASPTLTRSIIDCAQEAGKIETDSEALPAIGGDAGAEPTVTWSEGKQAPANLVSKTLTAADGPAVSSGDVITVNYVGWKWGSTEAFDSSFKKGAPVTFGLTGVIPGWTCGLAGHKVGERVQLSIPGKLAYGETADPARPNSPTGPLVFVVDITARITGDELTPATKDATVDSAAVKKLSDRGVTVSGDLGAPAAGLAAPPAEDTPPYEGPCTGDQGDRHGGRADVAHLVGRHDEELDLGGPRPQRHAGRADQRGRTASGFQDRAVGPRQLQWREA